MASNLKAFSVIFTDTQVVAGVLTITKPSTTYICQQGFLHLPSMPSYAVGVTNISSSQITCIVGEVPKGTHNIDIMYKL